MQRADKNEAITFLIGMKNTLTKPKTVIIAFGILFFFNLIIFSQTPKTGIDGIADTFGDWLQIGTFVTLIAVIAWYAVSGKSREQLKEKADGWKDTAERYRTENAELRTSAEARKAKIEELRKAREKDRILIYRMVARLEGQEIDVHDLGDLWEEV